MGRRTTGTDNEGTQQAVPSLRRLVRPLAVSPRRLSSRRLVCPLAASRRRLSPRPSPRCFPSSSVASSVASSLEAEGGDGQRRTTGTNDKATGTDDEATDDEATDDEAMDDGRRGDGRRETDDGATDNGDGRRGDATRGRTRRRDDGRRGDGRRGEATRRRTSRRAGGRRGEARADEATDELRGTLVFSSRPGRQGTQFAGTDGWRRPAGRGAWLPTSLDGRRLPVKGGGDGIGVMAEASAVALSPW